MKLKQRVVLAYSGGLDTSVAIPWLQENLQAEVIAVTLDLGQERGLEEVRKKALNTGAVKAIVTDVKQPFLTEFVWPSLRAGAIYEGKYPLATALSRPLIAKHLVNVAFEEGASAIAHGCTGKGNDQVRLELGIMALAPELNVIAPAREWGMSRAEEITFAYDRGIPIPVGEANPYSVDENLWGRSIEAGSLEDPWQAPPEDIYTWTKSINSAPVEPIYLNIEFEKGIPTAINGQTLNEIQIIAKLNFEAGEHGIGRIDHLENRLVGIKSREIYEAPAAVVLHGAHQALESLTLTREQQRFKEIAAQQYADLVYNGLWYSRHRNNLDSYVISTQEFVSGSIRVKFHKGTCTIAGRRSPYSLYSYTQATYDNTDQFDHRASEGFIKIFGLPIKTQAKNQPSEGIS